MTMNDNKENIEATKALYEAVEGFDIYDFDNDVDWHAAIAASRVAARKALDAGADVNANSGLWATPLCVAASGGDAEHVALLIDRGADLDGFDRMKVTPLMRAANCGHTHTVALLLDRGADVNALSSTGQTALMRAANHGYLDIVSLLLDRGADIDAREEYEGEEWTAEDMAIAKRHTTVVTLIRTHKEARALAAVLPAAPTTRPTRRRL